MRPLIWFAVPCIKSACVFLARGVAAKPNFNSVAIETYRLGQSRLSTHGFNCSGLTEEAIDLAARDHIWRTCLATRENATFAVRANIANH